MSTATPHRQSRVSAQHGDISQCWAPMPNPTPATWEEMQAHAARVAARAKPPANPQCRALLRPTLTRRELQAEAERRQQRELFHGQGL